EKPGRIRTESGLNVHLGRHKSVTGPNHEDSSKFEIEYIEVLGHHPNHTSGDYMRLAVSNIFERIQKLESPPGKKVELGRWERCKYAIGWLIARIALLLFALMPLFMGAYGIAFQANP
uniref:hypothetical protein n=1 Tax=Epibacterium ulvae TaxID=1156985 RepID=UPI00249382A2